MAENIIQCFLYHAEKNGFDNGIQPPALSLHFHGNIQALRRITILKVLDGGDQAQIIQLCRAEIMHETVEPLCHLFAEQL